MKSPTDLYGDNQGMIISSTSLYYELKIKHVAISYHKNWESATAGIVNPIQVCTTVNCSKMLKINVGGYARYILKCIIWSCLGRGVNYPGPGICRWLFCII